MNRSPANLDWLKKVAEWEEMDDRAETQTDLAAIQLRSPIPVIANPARSNAAAWSGRVGEWEQTDSVVEMCNGWWEAIIHETPGHLRQGTGLVAAVAAAANRQLRCGHVILERDLQRPGYSDISVASTLQVRAFSPYPAGRAIIFVHRAARPVFACYHFLVEVHSLCFAACDRIVRATDPGSPWLKPSGADKHALRGAWRFCKTHLELIADALRRSGLDADAIQTVFSRAEPPVIADPSAVGWGFRPLTAAEVAQHH